MMYDRKRSLHSNFSMADVSSCTSDIRITSRNRRSFLACYISTHLEKYCKTFVPVLSRLYKRSVKRGHEKCRCVSRTLLHTVILSQRYVRLIRRESQTLLAASSALIDRFSGLADNKRKTENKRRKGSVRNQRSIEYRMQNDLQIFSLSQFQISIR